MTDQQRTVASFLTLLSLAFNQLPTLINTKPASLLHLSTCISVPCFSPISICRFGTTQRLTIKQKEMPLLPPVHLLFNSVCGAKYMCHNRGEKSTEGREGMNKIPSSLSHIHTFFEFLPQFGIKCVYNTPRIHLFFFGLVLFPSQAPSQFFPAAFPYLADCPLLACPDRRNPQFQLRPNKVAWIEAQKRNLILFGESMDVQ
ncbi:MAG: hypothetical protein JOS17DRAFT_549798 [Linnemannia elongata]|nr:MAG: hypothetical protein JOS17DRAFT_549798 [Linnemannia elongata]